MTIVKNVSSGPRGIRNEEGVLIMLEPGQTSDDIRPAKGEIDDAKATGWFLFGKDATDDKAPAPALPLEAGVSSDALALVQAELDKALVTIDELTAENVELREKLAAFDHDGDGKPGGVPQAEPADDEQVKAALELLDPSKDEDWTAAGLPAVEAVATLAGGKVTRAQIEALAPDLTRDTAPKS